MDYFNKEQLYMYSFVQLSNQPNHGEAWLRIYITVELLGFSHSL